MAKPTTIEATYSVVTPLFCAGADSAHPELRLPSFKGVLRFWWRALAWPRYSGDLAKIQGLEDKLFGSADGGQSRVLLRLACRSTPPEKKIKKKGKLLTVAQAHGGRQSKPVGNGARYLGYGVMDTKARLTCACLAPFEFTVQLRCRDLSEEDLALLRNALIALGTLGGMGAKSRKGYGSLVLRSLIENEKQCWDAPESIDELSAAIGRLQCDREADGFPEYTAFSSGTRHILLSGGKVPLELLDRVGREMVRYRSWGQNGKVLNGIDSEKKFKDDHDLMTDNRPKKHHPRRIAFGLPHNYGKKEIVPADKDRRASPLFIHIHECGGAPIAVVSFLPARFLPQKKPQISVDKTNIPMVPEVELYRPIHAFLDRLLDKDQHKEPFDRVIENKSKVPA